MSATKNNSGRSGKSRGTKKDGFKSRITKNSDKKKTIKKSGSKKSDSNKSKEKTTASDTRKGGGGRTGTGDEPQNIGDLFSILKEFLAEFKKPYAWFFLLLGFIFATKSLEVIRALRVQEPLFSFLQPLFKDIGGILADYPRRYLKRIPAIMYQLVIPFLFVWIVYAVNKYRRPRKKMKPFQRFWKRLSWSFRQGGRDYGLSWSCLKHWWRYILFIFLLMLPFIFFVAQNPEFRKGYPYLSALREQRQKGVELQKPAAEKRREKRVAVLEEQLAELRLKHIKRITAEPENLTRRRLDRIDRVSEELDNTKYSYRDWLWATLALFIVYELIRVLYMFSWEFLFRGFMLNGLRDKFKYQAIFLQMIPYVMLHSTKPSLELYYTIPGGLLLGLLAYKTRSIWPGFLLHAVGAVVFDFVAMFV